MYESDVHRANDEVSRFAASTLAMHDKYRLFKIDICTEVVYTVLIT